MKGGESMNNYKFKLLIKSEEIYSKLIPAQKQLFNNIQITNATLLSNGEVQLECFALTNNVTETPSRQVMSFSTDEYITAIDA